jgi:hypothetical protein
VEGCGLLYGCAGSCEYRHIHIQHTSAQMMVDVYFASCPTFLLVRLARISDMGGSAVYVMFLQFR